MDLTQPRRVAVFVFASVGTLAIAVLPQPTGLSLAGQYAIATMFFAGVLWVTRALPLAVTALSIPVLLTGFGIYNRLTPALHGFADPLIFLFLAGFMLANALQKYNIDRRIALWMMSRLGWSPRLLVLAIMLATAFLSMWVSNTATTAMMTPIALGVLGQVLGRENVAGTEQPFSNMQIATLLGTAYAASVGGVGTLIGTPPNAVLVGYLDQFLDYQLTFADWLVIGLPIVVVTLPVVWWFLTFVLYPPEVTDITAARSEADRYLVEESARSAWPQSRGHFHGDCDLVGAWRTRRRLRGRGPPAPAHDTVRRRRHLTVWYRRPPRSVVLPAGWPLRDSGTRSREHG